MGLLYGVLLTHATTTRPRTGGEWEYVLWAIGTGLLQLQPHARPPLPRT